MDNLLSERTQEVRKEYLNADIRDRLDATNMDNEELINFENHELNNSVNKQVISNDDQDHINSDSVSTNKKFIMPIEIKSSSNTQIFENNECELKNGDVIMQQNTDERSAERHTSKQSLVLINSQTSDCESNTNDEQQMYCQHSNQNGEYQLPLEDQNQVIINEIPLNTNIPQFVHNLAVNLQNAHASSAHSLICIQTKDNKNKEKQLKVKKLALVQKKCSKPRRTKDFQLMNHEKHENNSQQEVADRIRKITRRKMVDKQVECKEGEEQIDVEPQKKKRCKKKRSRSAEECDLIAKKARQYLLDNPKYNLNDSNLFSYGTVRRSMERNKDEYISKRVLALVAEEVHKDRLKDKLFTGIVNELTGFLEHLSHENSNPVSADTLFRTIEQLLDDIKL